MIKLVFPFLFFTIFLQSQNFVAQERSITEGYKNGELIVIGGGKVGNEIMQEFRNLAGGDSAKIVVIPTAFVLNNEIDTLRIIANFEKHGFTDITILHTTDTVEANKDDFIKPIKAATGIYFTGGRQWRIADGFLNTKAHDEMFKLLDRGGVIAGTSAGATNSRFLFGQRRFKKQSNYDGRS